MATIAIDWDDTFTADPDLWRIFVMAAKNRGHMVVIITARASDSKGEIAAEAKALGVEFMLTSGQPKIAHADANGLLVNIWIDDMPGLLFSDVVY
jgi:hypothetical protein